MSIDTSQPDPGPPDQVWRLTITAIVVSPDDPANGCLDLLIGDNEWPHIVEVRSDHLATAAATVRTDPEHDPDCGRYNVREGRRMPLCEPCAEDEGAKDRAHDATRDDLATLADVARKSMVLQMRAAGIEGGE